MSFNQNSAPTGWTKDTSSTIDDSILRLVTGSVSSGGSTAFSTWNSTSSTGAYTLSTSEMPSHTHNVAGGRATATAKGSTYSSGSSAETVSAAEGGGGSHAHSLTGNIKYYDFIIAQKD
jgi:microcystin-dependent protein